MSPSLSPTLRRGPPAGMTLLEVLVACGILVVGLASVAAMLPAASSRLADATAIDRSGTLSANCFADLRGRQAFKASLFTADTIRIVMMGDLFSTTAAFGAAPFARRNSTALAVPASVFQLPDTWQLDAANIPQSQDGGVCCIATLAALDRTQPTTAGTLARLSIVVFRSSSTTAQGIRVSPIKNGVYSLLSFLDLTTGAERQFANTAAATAYRKRFLPACGAALAVPANGDPPRWLRVASSWTTLTKDASGNAVPDTSYVCFTDAALADQLAANGPLTVWGFSRLMRLDERTVTLE